MRHSDWKILYELYKHPNMTKVAKELYLTQPSLTKRLQQMEKRFEIEIVNRTPQGLVFTEEGTYLAKQAVKYLALWKETENGLEQMQAETKSPIVIGASYTYSKYELTDLLIEYREKHPNARFEIINEQSNVLFQKVLDGSVDVGFIRGDYEGQATRVCIGHTKGFLVTKEPVDITELPKMQRIGYRTNDKTKELLDAWWKEWFEEATPTEMMVGYIDVALEVVAKGMGYICCFLPETYKNEYQLYLNPLVKTDGSQVIRNTGFYYLPSKKKSPELKNFIAYIEREV